MWVWQDWDAPCRCVSLGFAGCKRWFSWTLVSWMMAWFVLHQRGRLSRTWEEQIIWSKESESFCLHRLMSLMSMRLIPQYVVKWEFVRHLVRWLSSDVTPRDWGMELFFIYMSESVQSDPSTNDTVYWCLLAYVSINHMENKDMKLISLSRCQRHPARSNAWRGGHEGVAAKRRSVSCLGGLAAIQSAPFFRLPFWVESSHSRTNKLLRH